jgi:holliday junction DNA helicase RuvA
MIVALRGKLVSKDPRGAVIDCGGVGYGLSMSLQSIGKLGAEGSDVNVLVYTHLSQDALRLFGFADAAERETFEVLIGTTGVGPKLALAILSSITPSELSQAVSMQDKGALTRIPGVGAKKAERLLVELKDRLPQASVTLRTPGRGFLMTDLVSALENLGFAAQVAEKAGREALEAYPEEQELATLVRAALRLTR